MESTQASDSPSRPSAVGTEPTFTFTSESLNINYPGSSLGRFTELQPAFDIGMGINHQHLLHWSDVSVLPFYVHSMELKKSNLLFDVIIQTSE